MDLLWLYVICWVIVIYLMLDNIIKTIKNKKSNFSCECVFGIIKIILSIIVLIMGIKTLFILAF